MLKSQLGPISSHGASTWGLTYLEIDSGSYRDYLFDSELLGVVCSVSKSVELVQGFVEARGSY